MLGLKDAVTADGGGSSVAYMHDTKVGSVWDGRSHGRIVVGYAKYNLHELPVLRYKIIMQRGVYVNLLQRLLNIPADGVFGKQTRAAVLAFQWAYALVPDGVVGQKTWKALMVNRRVVT